jgi:U4/U6 small nuclear ribonucleoprotein PRP4
MAGRPPLQVTVEDVADEEDGIHIPGGISFEALQSTEPAAPKGGIDTTNLRIHPEQAKVLKEMERKKRARTIPIPTDNVKVMALLRENGEPITLFGEDAGARRDRLREILSQKMERGEKVRIDLEGDEEDDEDEGEFYTPGTEALLDARKEFAVYSLALAKKRLERQRIEAQVTLPQIVRYRKALSKQLQTFSPLLSELGGSRAVSSIRFSPVAENDDADSQYVLTANWTGQLKSFTLPNLTSHREYRGHESMANGVSWLPSTPSISESEVNFISGGMDGEILLWNIDSETPIHRVQPHEERIFKTAIHPNQKYFAATSFDTTWSLTAFETQQTILQQPGHSAHLMACAFHPDGSLIVTGGRDAVGRIWDLRSGRTIMVLEGHSSDVLCADWSPVSGYDCLTGSTDGTLRAWDLRKIRVRTTLPVHTNGIADFRYFNPPSTTPLLDGTGKPQPQDRGSWLVSAGFDGKVKLWTADDFILQTELMGHQGRVLCCDVSPRGRFVASGGWDRSVRLYGSEELDMVKEEDLDVKMEDAS